MDEEAKELLRVIRDILLRREEREVASSKRTEEILSQSADRTSRYAWQLQRETRFAIFGAWLFGLIVGYVIFIIIHSSGPR